MNIRFASLLLFALPAAAIADDTLTASQLAMICSSSSADDRAVCSLVVKAYKDGFIEGVANGVQGTYRYDPQVLALVKDAKMKDFAPRLAAITRQATCIGSVQVEDLTKEFVKFVREHPALQPQPYRTAMFRTIESTFCGK